MYDGYEADARVHLVTGMGVDRTSVAEIAKAPRLEERTLSRTRFEEVQSLLFQVAKLRASWRWVVNNVAS